MSVFALCWREPETQSAVCAVCIDINTWTDTQSQTYLHRSEHKKAETTRTHRPTNIHTPRRTYSRNTHTLKKSPVDIQTVQNYNTTITHNENPHQVWLRCRQIPTPADLSGTHLFFLKCQLLKSQKMPMQLYKPMRPSCRKNSTEK